MWLTYDLGVGGDYNGLYSWLDDHEATECGNNVAFFKFQFAKTINTDDEFAKLLVSDLKKTIKFTPSNRLYILFKSLEKENTVGRFVIGKRKASPWEGFGSKADVTIDE